MWSVKYLPNGRLVDLGDSGTRARRADAAYGELQVMDQGYRSAASGLSPAGAAQTCDSTKGGRTTSQGSARPRTSTTTVSPFVTPDAVSSNARAIPTCAVGEKVPDVQTPICSPPSEPSTAQPSRGMPRPVARRPYRRRTGPSASATNASRPKNAGLSHPTAHPVRAWLG